MKYIKITPTEFGERVFANAQKLKKEWQEQQKVEFHERYNRKKVYQFSTIDKINMKQHFYLPRGFTSLSELTKAAISIYPVFCSQADFEKDKWFQLSRENLAKIAGINPLTADKGIQNLMKYKLGGSPLLERKLKTEGKRHFYLYRVGFIRKEMIENWKGQLFIFHTCIITSGIWAELSPRAKALYLAMRSVAQFDAEGYALAEDIEYYELDSIYGADYKDRKWDLCIMSLAELCRMVNIEASNIKEVMLQLEHYHLVECIDSGIFQVYLKPKIRDNNGQEDN